MQTRVWEVRLNLEMIYFDYQVVLTFARAFPLLSHSPVRSRRGGRSEQSQQPVSTSLPANRLKPPESRTLKRPFGIHRRSDPAVNGRGYASKTEETLLIPTF